MTDQTTAPEDSLEDFEQRELTFAGETVRTHIGGDGPAVVVMTEIPGITPHVARFARWVRDAGFTVWMPSLFGRDGVSPSPELAMESMGSGCVRREFTAFAIGETSPMAAWLRQLAAHAHSECGGPGVGAIGMCFTGNFALALMLEPAVLAPVMSQPSLPLDDPGGTYLTADELTAVRTRMDREDLTVLPDSSAAPSGWVGVPHSVVTTNLIDEAGQPTAAARDEILDFFSVRLRS